MADEKKEGSGYEFVPPDFDEDAFVHREMVSFRTTTILFVWGILAAAASWGAYVAVGGTDLGWLIGLALCGAFGYALKVLFPRLGADVSHFKRKEWVGTGFLFFFTWLSFFLVALNPPLTDVAPPQVFLSAGPPLQEAGAPVVVDVVAADNGRLEDLQVRVTRDGGDIILPFTEVAPGHLRGTLPTAAGRYAVAATATDAKGHVGRATANITIGRVLDVTWPAGNALAKPTDQVLVSLRVPPCAAGYPTYDCIRTVQLRALDGTPSITLEYSASDGGWRATPNFAGWTIGNHTYQAVAQYPTRFLGATAVGGGNITGPQATLEVRLPAGDHQVPILPDPTQRTIHVPAPSIGLAALALLGLALVLHRRGR